MLHATHAPFTRHHSLGDQDANYCVAPFATSNALRRSKHALEWCDVEQPLYTHFDHEVSGGLSIDEELFGRMPDGDPVFKITISNKANYSFEVLTFGAIVKSIKVPDKNGNATDVVLGYDTLDEYIDSAKYMGAILGRVAHRISDAKVDIPMFKDTKHCKLTANDKGLHHANGGFLGLNTKNFRYSIKGSKLILSCHSAHGEEGYPGNVRLCVSFQLNTWNEIIVDYEATADTVTPLNLSHRLFLNLSGQGNGDVTDHAIQCNGQMYLPTANDDPDCVTGLIKNVDNTQYDLRKAKTVGAYVSGLGIANVNQFYAQRTHDGNAEFEEKEIAKFYSEKTGILLELDTSCPGVMLLGYDAADDDAGKGVSKYGNMAGLAFICSGYPDTFKHSHTFPDICLQCGDVYYRATRFRFSVATKFPQADGV